MNLNPTSVPVSVQAPLARLQAVCRPSYPDRVTDDLSYMSFKRNTDLATAGASWLHRHATRKLVLGEPAKGWALRTAVVACVPLMPITLLATVGAKMIEDRDAEQMSPVRRRVRGLVRAVDAIELALKSGLPCADEDAVARKYADIAAIRQELEIWDRPWRDTRREVHARFSVRRALSNLSHTCDEVVSQLPRRQRHRAPQHGTIPFTIVSPAMCLSACSSSESDDPPPPYTE